MTYSVGGRQGAPIRDSQIQDQLERMTTAAQVRPQHRIIDQPHTAARIGARLRKETPGPEADLLGEFLHNLEIDIPRGCQATIFREPHLECGIPDLVVAVWHVSTAEKWVADRSAVTVADLRMLQYLLWSDGDDETDLRARFKGAKSGLDRLATARLVRRRGTMWIPMALSTTFALRRLIAIEAKIADWVGVVEQAWRNTWFACESHVLVPTDRARQHRAKPPRGVRVFTPERAVLEIRTRSRNVAPRSYASWLFNEWVWRDEIGAEQLGGIERDD